ncbi:uncharacterized protein LOC110943813 [Helianthus annuus]|uniref:uncharacterized protein LOC110943813 n=1 Tax=Helianthus annuus TaxID=4232 RepID=UPI000B9051BA|nr:uncharacterized protein LOC110943813 [Helianthus annuus]
MEALSGVMKKATSIGLFNGIDVSCNGPSLSHLIYADDVMFVGEWSPSNIINLRRMMRCFYLASGLKINLAKCSIFGIGVEDQEIQDTVLLLGCKQAVLAGGQNISFWLDIWADSLPLYLKFPALFKIESVKECLVADRIHMDDNDIVLNWAWARLLAGVEEQNQFQQLVTLIGCPNMSAGYDVWRWPDSVFEWNNWVPKKVGLVAWRADMERLPTKQALAARNVQIQDKLCVFCGEYVETSEHIFVSCHFAQVTWLNLATWWGLPPIIAFGLKDLLTVHGSNSGSEKKRKAIHAVVLVAIWNIWKTRNDALFRNLTPN